MRRRGHTEERTEVEHGSIVEYCGDGRFLFLRISVDFALVRPKWIGLEQDFGGTAAETSRKKASG